VEHQNLVLSARKLRGWIDMLRLGLTFVGPGVTFSFF